MVFEEGILKVSGATSELPKTIKKGGYISVVFCLKHAVAPLLVPTLEESGQEMMSKKQEEKEEKDPGSLHQHGS